MTRQHSVRELASAGTLFVLTLLSALWVGSSGAENGPSARGLVGLVEGASFALPLMAILSAHELGHYVAARLHGVPTSLPYFIPMPYSLIGTFGAIIRTSARIRSRNALLDIGAAGPLSGLAVAIPVLAYGLFTSEVKPVDPTAAMEGRSILYAALLYATHGSIPDGYDIYLNGTALAGWAGLLVTMMNLVPTGQLDGGHVAFAFFGERQNRYSRHVRTGLFYCALLIMGAHLWGGPLTLPALGLATEKAANWLMWWVMLGLMARLAGEDHPPMEQSPLSPGRRVVAVGTLALFGLLFMPTWFTVGSDAPTQHASTASRAQHP